VGRPMLSSLSFPTAPIDLWGTAVVGSRPALFPVARTIGGAIWDGHLHLVDGDGASLCEGFTPQELEWLPLVWAEIVEVDRCRACEALGCSSVTTDGYHHDG
jgi:hypothetical protein